MFPDKRRRCLNLSSVLSADATSFQNFSRSKQRRVAEWNAVTNAERLNFHALNVTSNFSRLKMLKLISSQFMSKQRITSAHSAILRVRKQWIYRLISRPRTIKLKTSSVHHASLNSRNLPTWRITLKLCMIKSRIFYALNVNSVVVQLRHSTFISKRFTTKLKTNCARIATLSVHNLAVWTFISKLCTIKLKIIYAPRAIIKLHTLTV